MLTLIVSIVAMLAVAGGLGFFVSELRSRTKHDIEHAPRGAAAPVGGAVAPLSNVFGGLRADERGDANTPQGRSSPHLYAGNIPLTPWAPGLMPHAVGGTCGGDNGVGYTIPGCDGGCDSVPPARKWVLAQQLSSSMTAAGQPVQVDLSGVQPTDRKGRIAHIVGIRLQGTWRIVAGATNAALSGYQLLTAFSNIFLQDKSGWEYCAGLDGRDWYDDRYAMSNVVGVEDVLPTAIAVNAGAGNIDTNINLYWPLTQFRAKGHEALFGCIPLFAIQAQGPSAFRFTSPSNIVGAPAGLTPSGLVGTTEVWLELVYLDKPFLDRPFQLETYVEVKPQFNLNRCDRTMQYAYARNFPEESASAPQYMSGYGGTTVQAAGDEVFSALTQDQWEEFTIYHIFDYPLATDASPSLFSGGNMRLLAFIPNQPTRPAMPAGEISVKFASRTATQVRILQRSIACQQDKRNVALLGAKTPVVGVDPSGNPVKPTSTTPYVAVPLKQ